MKSLRASALFDRLAERTREARIPQGFTFELTYGCNLRCVQCYNPTHRAYPRELSTAEACAVLAQAAELGVIQATFSGGEPLARPDVFDILREARRLGLLVTLLSNATRITPVVADALEEIGLETLYVSLYGARQQTYERVTAVAGSYDAFRGGLVCLAGRALPTVVRMPVMTDNAHEVEAARALVEQLGLKFQYCLDIMPRTDGALAPLAHRLPPEEKVRVDGMMAGSGPTDSSSLSCSVEEGFLTCACGRNRFAVTPYGEMNLCVAFPIPRFDLRRGSLREGWEVLKHTVDRARPNARYECPSCEFRPYCRQGRSDAWLETGDMSRCLPHFKEFARLEKHADALLDPRRPA